MRKGHHIGTEWNESEIGDLLDAYHNLCRTQLLIERCRSAAPEIRDGTERIRRQLASAIAALYLEHLFGPPGKPTPRKDLRELLGQIRPSMERQKQPQRAAMKVLNPSYHYGNTHAMVDAPFPLTPTTIDIMEVLLAANKEMHGKQIASRSKHTSGTVNQILTRMVQHGWVDAQWETKGERRGRRGPRRRFYRIAPTFIPKVHAILVDRGRIPDRTIHSQF